MRIEILSCYVLGGNGRPGRCHELHSTEIEKLLLERAYLNLLVLTCTSASARLRTLEAVAISPRYRKLLISASIRMVAARLPAVQAP